MSTSTLFSFEPTFTQGFIVGQFSIVIILILVLRHLFFDSRVGRRLETPTYHPHLSEEKPSNQTSYAERCGAYVDGGESAVWFNVILRNVSEALDVRRM
jgi:maintenance of morphology protein 1